MSEQALSFKDKLLKAGTWIVAGFALAQIIRLGGNLILTRLLFPESFGLMAVVYMIMAGMTVLSDIGINQNIVQSPRGNEQEFLNTAWSVKILRGLLICMMMLFIAYMLPRAVSMGWISKDATYADPLLPSILAIISITALLQGAESTKIALLQRQVQMKKLTLLELVGQVFALVVMMILALLYHNVWSLVVGSLVARLSHCLMSHYWLPGPSNKLQWNSSCFNEIFNFGKWIFLLSIVGFIASSGDRIILGGLLDSATLGVYAIAFFLFSSLQSLYGSVLYRVVFPAFCEVSGSNSKRIRKISGRFQLMADIFLFGGAGFLFTAGDSIINLLYDERYHDAGSMLSVLGLGLIGMRHFIIEQWWLATALMRPLFFSKIVRLIVLFSGVLWGFTLMGISGALIGIVMSYFAWWPIALFFRFRERLIDWKYEFIGVPVFMISSVLGESLSWLMA